MDQPAMASNTQLYLDQKGELEAEERKRHEMGNDSIRYEMEGEDRIFEVPSDRDTGMGLASLRETHEMGGVEHSNELEVPSIAH